MKSNSTNEDINLLDNLLSNKDYITNSPLDFRKKCYPIGLKIKSKPVGIIGEFIGNVTDYTQHEIIVRDFKTQKRWVRSPSELEILDDQD